MDDKIEMSIFVDDEENERKLLADTSDDEVNEINQKVDDENEVLKSDPGDELDQLKHNKLSEDDDSNNSNNKHDEADESEIHLLEKKLTQNPYDYESHKLLISKFHKMGDLDRLRFARENMSSKYPLTPDLWLSWLRDEIKLATTPEQKCAVVEICERAITDYLSVEVWLEYLQFSIGLDTEKDSIEKMRNLFERALTAAGLHVMKGSLIWDAFREFESFIALTMDSKDSQKKNQINRIGKLYQRQLTCPLFHMEKAYEEYRIWKCAEGCEYNDDKIVKSGYQKAKIELNARIPFEEKLESAQNKNEQLDIYKAYLFHEKQIGDPGRITVLYERALTDICLEPVLWIDYLQFVEYNIKINDIIDKIYMRAVRNIPWCVKIWQNWIRFCEKKNTSLIDIQKLVENALTVGFSSADEYKKLWITYLEYLRRRVDYKSDNEKNQLEILRNAFNRAYDHIASFGIEGDPTCEILQFWARSEAIHANNMEKARWLWTNIMSQGHSESAASWIEYISLEKCYGDSKHIRKLFQKALIAVKDWPESVANAWINFERDEGTLEQIEICESKIQEQLIKISEERKEFELYSTMPKEIVINKKTGKRKGEDTGRWKDLGASTFKISKLEQLTKPMSRKDSINQKVDESSNEFAKNMKSNIAPLQGYKKIKEKIEDSYNFHELDDQITIFVSNLDYTATEEEIEEVLKPVCSIKVFRMIKDYKGRSKGYGYIQLGSSKEVEEALKLDRIRLNGRPMFISRCDPNKTSRSSGFKYKTVLEKNKLFVKGLPLTTTKEELHQLFKIHGKLKDIRIVTYRNGHSKGLAYVEFEDINSARKALVATDGLMIEEKIISVSVSQPPQRKQVLNNDNVFSVKSLGGSSTSRSTFGNPKTVLSLVPQVVKKNVASDQMFDNGVTLSMNNSDFKNMLCNKK
ncbi:PREDICTED: squamous cell carcinoma antigen recognized by T-cells 3 [Ceratosolen solmsi marchali]|uniref:Squamous cell carcinoma antigen recognized by T-cells 3 n=1 Tax=Ceratosolen solmsi marchali TaxID=326594 RepID=A0AAJ6YJQ8_9HYME|nr:PREDICTED: squamous cell carcinoma antigen recognized by T-cells 3 [Ceratosolen solmsi marchali]